MVGMVIVSHSKNLAEALVDLARQVASKDAPIAFAAGVGPNRETFGTDATDIMAAVEKVDSPDGIIVLMDIGSSVLSAQMAMELLPPEISKHVHLCSAPLVEGAIAAAVQISLGSPIEMVLSEAQHATLPKQSMITDTEPETAVQRSGTTTKEGKNHSATVKIVNQHGLHARPAARFVQNASNFISEITVKDLTNGRGPVSSRSLNAIATLGAVEHHKILISASGEDAVEAVNTLKTLVESGFGEPSAETESAPPASKGVAEPALMVVQTSGETPLQAVPVSEGYACGPLLKYRAPIPEIPSDSISDAKDEWDKFISAVQKTEEQIESRGEQIKASLQADQAAIFDAHRLILKDPDLQAQVHQMITNGHLNAAAAWDSAIHSTAENYRSVPDAYLQQRSLDVEDVGRQVLWNLLGTSSGKMLQLDHPVILLAEELTPTETSQLDLRHVLGIITFRGGPTSHSAILARGLGIPSVTGVHWMNMKLEDGSLVGLNGFTGETWFNPDPETVSSLQLQRNAWLSEKRALLEKSSNPARTNDGTRVEVFANIGKVEETGNAIRNGAEGVGLLRTEFMFLTREKAPLEEEQYRLLREIFEAMGPHRPITVRTMDIGGDKRLPYIDLSKEENPFLGMRALRLSLEQPESLFLPQLRAILRAADGFACRIMFPMVADAGEIVAAREWVDRAQRELTEEGIPHAWPVELGIMVEIPSAALMSAQFAKRVDFFSIGTNDLTQYTLAAERGNPSLSYLADGLHPAVLRLIQTVCEAAHQENRGVGVCGELGGNPQAIPILIGLGVNELSMNATAIPQAKSIIRELNIAQARELAQQAVSSETSQQVHRLAAKYLHTD